MFIVRNISIFNRSIVMESNRSLWMSYMCTKRYSDSEMYSKAYRSLKYTEDAEIINIKSLDHDLRHNNSINISQSDLEVPYMLF